MDHLGSKQKLNPPYLKSNNMFGIPPKEKAFMVTPFAGSNYSKGLEILRFELDREMLKNEDYRKNVREMINTGLKDCIAVLGPWNTRCEQFDGPVPLTKERARHIGMPPNPQCLAGSIQMWKDVEKKYRMIEARLTYYENTIIPVV